jgi:hypothetical protein
MKLCVIITHLFVTTPPPVHTPPSGYLDCGFSGGIYVCVKGK